MSWIQKLYETYEQCASRRDSLDSGALLEPICHTSQQAHIEVSLDDNGRFLRAHVIPKGQGVTLVPCTEASVGRAGSKPVNHPLCDKLQYLAGDFIKYGGVVTSGFAGEPAEPHKIYLSLLSAWANSSFAHPKIIAIQTYVQDGNLVGDLVREKILPINEDEQLLAEWAGDKKEAPAIFGIMPNGNPPDGAVIRWRVETPGEPLPETWKDQSLIDAWIGFYTSQKDNKGLCLVTGDSLSLAEQHPSKLRHGADKAKFISSNDTSGFTFRGRFIDADQACGVGFEVTQKAHNALRWLIDSKRKQAYRNGDQAIVAWTVSGKRIPAPTDNSFELFGVETDGPDTRQLQQVRQGDAGQAFGRRLAMLLAGYRAELGSTNEVMVMGLDSATPGRMAMTYYRELDHTEFLDRIEAWHRDYAWHQNYSKDIKFVGAPAPRDIAEAAFRRLDENLRKATVERLLPCIIDSQKIPRDLVESTVRRASNRVGLEYWEWEKYLGIACALFSGYHKERGYQMALELNRTSRDYLYGRLLAIAESIEKFALDMTKESRDTSAAKLMQRFADHPNSTWRNIELSLIPYKSRLRSRAPGFLYARERQLDEVTCLFQGDDFMDERKLSGEFLLGYHCQRQALRTKPETEQDENIEATVAETN
ncbi:type I-C CRISPR-associated protein Cas8c/Csd1 [Nitrosospira sp. Nsp1]|uniref:type I-C CRISPR-associated protein Cas8c/Csd1 n=1 Tax=Nitrosospira sp. Nsp1 TaxID=136547 RepID=UPI00087F461B|nr:type I-C CRISPR-associated protein Cas8c/Csd1 [Nitrosospira sp. Nsp1]SCX54583.1 CRISPR-associated protein, Csd1 family [Nitrosospira sp. Nsp1]